MSHNISPVKRFDEDQSIIIDDKVLPVQKAWKDGEKYVIVLRVEQEGRDTMFDGGSTRYKVLKSEGHSQDEAMANKVKDRT